MRVTALLFWLVTSQGAMAFDCAQPGQSLCDSAPAQRARFIKSEVFMRYRSLRAKARYEQDSYLGACPYMAWQTGILWASCHELVLRKLSQELVTPVRARIARAEFENARTQILAILDLKIARTKAPPERAALLERRRAIERARLELDLGKAARAAGNLDSLASEKSWSVWNAFTDIAQAQVFLGAPIALAEEYPLHIRWIFAHELAHLMGPTSLTAIYGNFQGHTGIAIGFRPWSKEHMPYLEEVECLMLPKAGAPRKRDYACMEAQLKESNEYILPSLKPFVERTEKLLRESPIFSVALAVRDQLLCQQDQTEEVFADAIAAQSLPESLTASELETALAPQCVEESAPDSPLAEHPQDIERLTLIFRSEHVRKIARCESIESEPLSCLR